MVPNRLFLTSGFLAFVLCAGCGTVSPLYIPSSNAPERSFPPTPPAVIRLPISLTVPQVDGLGNGLSDLFHGRLKEGIPELAHWTGHEGFQISKKLALWNITGGKLLLGTTIHWLESIGKSKNSPVTQPTPSASNGPTPVVQATPGEEKTNGFFRVGIPLLLGKDWRLIVQNPTPVVEEPKKSIPRQTAETVLRLEQYYTHVQIDQLNQVLKGVIDLRPKAADIWDLMQQPIFLDKGVWLLIRPENISTGIMRANPHSPLKFETVLELWSYPTLYFGDNPEVQKKPLPPLAPFVPGKPGFRAVSNVSISFKEANRFLRDPQTHLMNTVIPGTGAQKLTVRGIRLYGAGGKVVAEVKLSYNPLLINFTGKPAQMTIYFRGTPHYSLKKRLFYLPDLDFDVKTTDFLVQVADWILKSDIRKELRKKARIPVGPKLDFLKERMNIVLNHPLNSYASLSTKVHSFGILDSFTDQDGIQARVALDGESQLNVVW